MPMTVGTNRKLNSCMHRTIIMMTNAPEYMDFEYDSVKVLVDSMSWQYLQGASIRYEETAMGSSFAINNPQAVSTCGCGSSFSPT